MLCWQVLLQYLVWHLTHRGASWASGAAQAAHVVRIILRFAVSFGLARRLDSAWKTRFLCLDYTRRAPHRNRNTVYHTLST